MTFELGKFDMYVRVVLILWNFIRGQIKSCWNVVQRVFSLFIEIIFICSFSNSADVLTSYPCPKICGCYQGNLEEETISVVCHLDALKPGLNFSVGNTRVSSILYLMCSSDGPYSEVSENMFISLTSFIGLRIENCKIPLMSGRFLFGLESLEHLEIKSAGTLKMSDSLFYHVPKVTHITITSSHVTKMPDLCQSSNLEYLNLTNNDIHSVDLSGLDCENDTILSELSTVILDKNSISKLFKRNFRSTPYITDLRIADARLSTIEDDAFSILKRLVYLDITNNSLTKVSPSMFYENSDMQVLGLGRNRFSNVHNDTLRTLQDLIVLTLDDLGLDNLVWGTLYSLRALKDLQLQNNRITALDQEVLFNLHVLQNLNLGNNSISDLNSKQHLFQNLKELRFLHLNRNKLQKISSGTFMGLTNIVSLDLSGNKIQQIETTALEDLNSITKLDFSQNILTRIPNIKTCQKLRWLDISSNHLKKLTSASLEGLSNLEYLNLSSNHITTIERNVLLSIPKLITLDLSFNQVKTIHVDAFDGLKHLSEFNIHHNLLKTISKAFLVLSSLKIVDLSFNMLMELQNGIFPDHVENIDLSYNRIGNISEYAIRNHQYLRRLSLKGNKLTTLSKNALSIPRNLNKPTMAYLADNPFNCDCNLIWLRRKIGDISMNSGLPMVGDIYSILCFGGYEIRTPKPLADVNPDNMLCAFEAYCTNTCTCCELDACDCLYRCPKECSCYAVSNTSYVTQCSNRGLNTLSVQIPFLTTELSLDRNNISDINSKSFEGLFNIRVIHLDQCGIKTLSNYSFIGLPLLDILFLNNNNIQRITNGVFSGLWNLTELHLEFNELSSIEDNAFMGLESLSILFLHHNNLKTLPNSAIRLFWKLNDITLVGNPLSCNCDIMNSFLPRLTDRSKTFPDLNVSMCKNARFRKQTTVIYNLASRNCAIIESKKINHETYERWVYIVISLIVIVMFTPIVIYGIITILYSRRNRPVNQQTSIKGIYERVNLKAESSSIV
uniref:Toll-like receptor Tollo isoform X2 n=1 Tax=Crassostrea virginica TaxID=6565 RepID=A0A8B8AT12_CRAVI|nr:toll-like receptor Tollo isoform X2 [Crassostrea virginica]